MNKNATFIDIFSTKNIWKANYSGLFFPTPVSTSTVGTGARGKRSKLGCRQAGWFSFGKKKTNKAERRKYIRLNYVYPVEFVPVDAQGQESGPWQQGTTSNISRGGICLYLKSIDRDIASCVYQKEKKIALKIYVPLYRPPVVAQATVAWMRESTTKGQDGFELGIEFTSITKEDSNRMMRQARWSRFAQKLGGFVIAALILAVGLTTLYSIRLKAQNNMLVRKLVLTQQKESQIKSNLEEIKIKKSALSDLMLKNEKETQQLEKELKSAKETLQENARFVHLKKEEGEIKNRYAQLLKEEGLIEDELNLIRGNKTQLVDELVYKMVHWLSAHQNPETGLVKSFEGHVSVIENWAFIYDQALAAHVFLIFDQPQKAQDIFNFFVKTRRKQSKSFEGFTNAYYVDTGDVAEYTVHCGPNIWMGIAIIQYTHERGDRQYLWLAKDIADWLIMLQEQDREGGLRGGPQFFWYATEHNLDAYAFFDMLYEVTKDTKYRLARDKVLGWLQEYSMMPHGKDYQRPPVQRGRGDATIATDTFAWSLAALGIDTLNRLGMNPEEIMRFAEEHCAVKVRFKRPSGVVVTTKGFDFSKPAHVARGGLISPEWSAQMIISYQILGDYFLENDEPVKGYFYREKSELYLSELNKLIIASPSPKGQGAGCLPYATLEDADTGHGWRTPQGSSTGSIAGTAYMIMAIKEFNPLQLKGE